MTVFPDVIWDLISRYHSIKHDLICCLNSMHTHPPSPEMEAQHAQADRLIQRFGANPNAAQLAHSYHCYSVPVRCYIILKPFSHTRPI